jgi:hypothetical protein
MTHDEFKKWLARSPKGSRRVYHTGNLVADRGPDEHRFKTEKQKEVCRIADDAWSAMRAGRLALSQQRNPSVQEGVPDDFNYIAEKL